ncbi:MAG: TetR/AcrR family transcriptional regulator [Blastococcus sp.]|jgi:AcrR family transcriptional regulator|nr:TetR/AcrR family transcriptional regulator [Blastococcus sp.]
MSTEIHRSGDRDRLEALLWRAAPVSGRTGARPALGIDPIVVAAVRLADAEGLAALSMRRVAGELGVGAMTLYGHVPGRGELLALMLDAVLGELHPDERSVTSGNWRARLDAVARANRTFLLRHPWAAQVTADRPPMGPNALRKYELELRAVDGLGLSEPQMDHLVTLVDGFIRGSVGRGQAPPAGALAGFPTAARVVAATTSVREDPERSFEFGLERLLDGIGMLIVNPGR